MQKTEFTYTGGENLEVMCEAKKYNSFLASLVLLQKINSAAKILDIGAGIGVIAEILREKGFDVSCFEPDLKQAMILTEKKFPVYTSLEEIATDFDFIYAFNVLEHVENDTDAIASWAKKLKSDGQLLIYVPAFNILFSSMDKKVGHFRRYTRKTLMRTVAKAKLGAKKTAKYADCIGFFVTLIYKILGNNNGNINKKSLLFYDQVLFPASQIIDLFLNQLFGKNVYVVIHVKQGEIVN
jgi:SAM-dependent methyltransferase